MLNNPDFYPTPRALFNQLIGGNIYNRRLDGKILEPSAGKGDMIEHIKSAMGYRSEYDIDAIENDPDLVNTLMGAGYNVVWNDFLTYETFKEYDYIIMNPPFSAGVDHVLKAIELAESQITACQIYAILNKQTIDNAYTTKRQELLRKLDRYGAKIKYVEGAFAGEDSQRKTNVEVALIDVMVTKDYGGKSVYDSIPFEDSADTSDSAAIETALSTYVESNEIADKLNDIERMVLEYEKACEVVKEAFAANKRKVSYLSYISEMNKREGDVTGPFSYIDKSDYTDYHLKQELDGLRREYWALLLDTDDFRERLTSDGRERLKRQLGAANALEINYANIQMLLSAIHANRGDMLVESIVKMFERITQYHMNEYSTNIHYYDGWKTNDAYRINHKIIIPIKHSFDPAWDIKEDYGRINGKARDFIDDIIKALQLIDPSVSGDFEYIGNNSFENETLRFRMFLNGNIHVWFNDRRLLAKLNYLCGQHFDWIPTEGEQKESEEARSWVAKEFGDIGEVKLLRA